MEKPSAKWLIDIQLQSLCIGETLNTKNKSRSKSSSSTDGFTNTVVFNDLNWETARAKTVDEAEELAKQGFTKYDIIGEVHLYRRIKA